MTRAYVGLGSNLQDPAAQVRAALMRLNELRDCSVIARSALYRSAPVGPGPQPDYCNAVCAVETKLTPDALLTQLHGIERSMGRARPPVRWAPRLIDLDLLLHGTSQLHTTRLTLPHPELHRRNFVLTPLAEIAPALEIPGLGAVAALAAAAGMHGLAPWDSQR